MRFKRGMRVRIANPAHPLFGEVGTVVRPRMQDRGAWVRMDKDVGRLASFSPDDARHNDVLLFPDDAEKES